METLHEIISLLILLLLGGIGGYLIREWQERSHYIRMAEEAKEREREYERILEEEERRIKYHDEMQKIWKDMTRIHMN